MCTHSQCLLLLKSQKPRLLDAHKNVRNSLREALKKTFSFFSLIRIKMLKLLALFFLSDLEKISQIFFKITFVKSPLLYKPNSEANPQTFSQYFFQKLQSLYGCTIEVSGFNLIWRWILENKKAVHFWTVTNFWINFENFLLTY